MDMALPSQARFVLDAPLAKAAGQHEKSAAEETTPADAGVTFGRQLADMDQGAPAGAVAAQAAAVRGRAGGDAGNPDPNPEPNPNPNPNPDPNPDPNPNPYP